MDITIVCTLTPTPFDIFAVRTYKPDNLTAKRGLLMLANKTESIAFKHALTITVIMRYLLC
jgi:hypothetical protein